MSVQATNTLEIIAHGRKVDGVGALGSVDRLIQAAQRRNLRVKHLKTASLEVRWQKQLPPDHVKSACSPMQAILIAQDLIDRDEIDLLILSGEELLASHWKSRKQERQHFMDIYGEGKSPFTEYNKVAAAFCAEFELTRSEFHQMAGLLFDNYLKTRTRITPGAALPERKWFEFVSDYFRGVDCANPNVDFTGTIAIASSKLANDLQAQLPVNRFPIPNSRLQSETTWRGWV